MFFYDETTLQDLWKLYHATEVQYAHQDHSLHHVERRNVHTREHPNPIFSKMVEHYANIGYHPSAMYFLKYSKYYL